MSRFIRYQKPREFVEQWQAWRLGERESYPITLNRPVTIDEAVNQAIAGARQAGDTLAIQHSHAGRGEHTVWFFDVKSSNSRGFWRDSTNGGKRVWVRGAEAKLRNQVALSAPFSPVEPFDAFRDDPVGVDRQIVEGRL